MVTAIDRDRALSSTLRAQYASSSRRMVTRAYSLCGPHAGGEVRARGAVAHPWVFWIFSRAPTSARP